MRLQSGQPRNHPDPSYMKGAHLAVQSEPQACRQ